MSPRSITIPFLALILGVPLFQAVWELAREGRVQALEISASLEAEKLRAFDRALREASLIHREVSPWYQWLLLKAFGRGNEKTIVGRDGWLHYADDLDVLTSSGFLERDWTPVDCIADVRDQLAARGIELLVVPVPPKSMLVPERLSRWTQGFGAIHQPDIEHFHSLLQARGVHALDLRELLGTMKSAMEACYLVRDTHWTPRAMVAVARRLGEEISMILGLSTELSAPVPSRLETVRGRGDLVEMLRLPPGVQAFPAMEVELERPLELPEGGVSDPSAPVLLIGDSFTRVFSDPSLGLGEGAGLGEQLAAHLHQSIDVIALAGGGARAVREALARRSNLAADQGGLAGKRLVVWEFALRDLAAAPEVWERVELGPAPSESLPAQGSNLLIEAELAAVVPLPETFDYAFGLAVFGWRVRKVLEGECESTMVWVAHPVVEDYRATADARLAVGERWTLRLEPIEAHYDLETTSWFRHRDMDVRAAIWFPVARTAVQ